MKRLILTSLSVFLAGLAGCEGPNAVAPAISPRMVAAAAGKGYSEASLATGRRLLATRCTSCHSLEPVASRTPVEWRAVVRDMADRSGLNAEEERQVAEYLAAARESL